MKKGLESLKCGYCHEPLQFFSSVRHCRKCRAVFHDTCWYSQPFCPTYGCAEQLSAEDAREMRLDALTGWICIAVMVAVIVPAVLFKSRALSSLALCFAGLMILFSCWKPDRSFVSRAIMAVLQKQGKRGPRRWPALVCSLAFIIAGGATLLHIPSHDPPQASAIPGGAQTSELYTTRHASRPIVSGYVLPPQQRPIQDSYMEAQAEYHRKAEEAAQAVPGGRFIDNEDGTVTDQQSGLMWAAADSRFPMTWFEADQYCNEWRVGGWSDWRLPTLDELQGIYDENYSRDMPCGTTHVPNHQLHVAPGININCDKVWSSGGFSLPMYYPPEKSHAFDGYRNYRSATALPVRSARGTRGPRRADSDDQWDYPFNASVNIEYDRSRTPRVCSLLFTAGNLYMGGDFSAVNGVPARNIARWDGTRWSALGPDILDGTVRCMTSDGHNLYAGGRFVFADRIHTGAVARWDGKSWNGLPKFIPNDRTSRLFDLNQGADAVLSDGVNLYAGGYFFEAWGIPAKHIAKWDGAAWSAMGEGLDAPVKALAWDGANLYAAGGDPVDSGRHPNYVMKWDGRRWTRVGTAMKGVVYALAWDGSSLYAGGSFYEIERSDAKYIARWDGRTWRPLGTRMYNTGSAWGGHLQVTALACDHPGVLFVGGRFNQVGGIYADFVARWDGDQWVALGSGIHGPVETLASDGTSLYAGGIFELAGGKVARLLARWKK